MIVTLDGRRLDHDFAPETTLQSLVDNVRLGHLGHRLVVEITCDGRSLQEDELAARLPLPVHGAGQIDLNSAEREEVACAALSELSDQLDEAAGRHRDLGRLLSAGQISKAVGEFGDLLQVWHGCQHAISDASDLLARDLTAEECCGQSVAEHVSALVRKLRELRDTFESRDMVLLADLLQYEMPEICESWRDMLRALGSRIRSSE